MATRDQYQEIGPDLHFRAVRASDQDRVRDARKPKSRDKAGMPSSAVLGTEGVSAGSATSAFVVLTTEFSYQASGISRPYASRVIASGSGPPRRPVSRPSTAAISSADSAKSDTSMFSAMRVGSVDFGITDRPSSRPQRSMTCAGLLPWA